MNHRALIVDDIVHHLLILCDINTYSNMIVNKHIYNHCNQHFWIKKLEYFNLPFIKPTNVNVFKSTLYAQQLAKQIIIMNNNTKNMRFKKIISIDFYRNDNFNKIHLPIAFNKAITFNPNNYEMPCECISIKLKNDLKCNKNYYQIRYKITHYDTGKEYLNIKSLCSIGEVETLLIYLLFGSYGYRDNCFEFHTYFLNHVTITNDQQDDYVVYNKSLVIYEDYDKDVIIGG